MHRKKTHQALIIVSVILVMIVTGFTGGLNIGSFKKTYTNSLVAGYSVVAAQYIRKIEYALQYGKPLANFYGLIELLQEAKQESKGIQNIRVVSKDGTILYDLARATVNQKLPQPLLLHNSFNEGRGAEDVYHYFLYQKDYYIYLPIYDRADRLAGSMEMRFNKSLLDSRTQMFFWQIISYSLLLGLAAIVILVILIFRFQWVSLAGDVNRKLSLVTIVIILSMMQIALGVVNYGVFKKVYTEIAKEYTTKTAILIQKDINQVIGKGVAYQDLQNINQWLKRFLKSTPEIERVDITDEQDKILYSSHLRVSSKPVGSEYRLGFPLRTDSLNTTAVLKVELSQKYIQRKLSAIALDMLTVLVTSFIFMIEVMLFLAIFLKKPKQNELLRDQTGNEQNEDHLVRPLGFIIYFSAFMSISFIPLLMKDLYQPIWGLPENIILGLPISAELLCGALAALLAGYLMGIHGWKPVFFLGLICFGCGAFLSGMAREATAFILARGVFGVGYGFCLIAMQGYANSAIGFDAKNQEISELTAGSYAGMNCGCVLGAMLGERIGFSNVFYVTFFTGFLAAVYVLLYMKNSIIPHKPKTAGAERPKGLLVQFLGDRKLWSFFLLIVIPVAVCTMFLEYFLPLYSKAAGVSAADVGRVFLLNGLAVVYLGPWISRITGQYLGFKSRLILFASIAAAAMLIFAHFHSFSTACISAILLGVAIGFGDASQNNYLLSLDATKNLGEGIAIGFLNVMSKIGQTIGPIVFGLLMAFGAAMGVGMIGWGVLGFLLLFIMVTFSTRKQDGSIKVGSS